MVGSEGSGAEPQAFSNNSHSKNDTEIHFNSDTDIKAVSSVLVTQ